MVAKGVQLCRALVERMNTVEEMLVRRPDTIMYDDGMAALRGASEPFEKLVAFNQELMMLHKMYVKKKDKTD